MSPVGILTPILDYTRCFLNHPYEQNACIINDSDLPVKYDLIPQVITPFFFFSVRSMPLKLSAWTWKCELGYEFWGEFAKWDSFDVSEGEGL